MQKIFLDSGIKSTSEKCEKASELIAVFFQTRVNFTPKYIPIDKKQTTLAFICLSKFKFIPELLKLTKSKSGGRYYFDPKSSTSRVRLESIVFLPCP